MNRSKFAVWKLSTRQLRSISQPNFSVRNVISKSSFSTKRLRSRDVQIPKSIYPTCPPTRSTWNPSNSILSLSTLHIKSRNASSSTATKNPAFEGIEPVDLAHDLIQPPSIKKGAEGQCMVICHGLFGSKQNWRSLAKAFSVQLGMPIYTIDLRNHGTSPHAEPHTYAAMATDLDHLFRKLNLKKVNLLGHSMGGKAVMAFALNPDFNQNLRSLISVDMSPAIGRISPEFAAYTQGMRKVDKSEVKSKAEADKILQEVEPVLATRQFLLTNTRTLPSGHLTFRIPLDLLDRSIPHIGDFPYSPPSDSESSAIWSGPTLFLKGEHSKYINRRNIPVAKGYFPEMRLEILNAGHWVHAEQPGETVRLVKEFVEGVGK